MPLVKPPWGSIVAIDMNKGEILWKIANAETPDNVRNSPALKGLNIPRTGRASNTIDGVNFISADLLDPTALRAAVSHLKPSHIFFTTWLRQPTEAENIRINSAMVRNLLEAVSPAESVRHVALVTGLKHYLGPFEAYGKGALPQTPFRVADGGVPRRSLPQAPGSTSSGYEFLR